LAYFKGSTPVNASAVKHIKTRKATETFKFHISYIAILTI